MKRFVPYFRFLRPVRVPFIAALAFGAINALASGFGLPFASQKVFPILFGETPPTTLQLIGGILILPAAFLVRGVSGYLNTYLMTYCSLRVLRQLQLMIFAKLQRLPLQFFHATRTGDLMSRIMGDANALNGVLTRTSNDLVKQPLTLLAAVGALAYFAYQDRQLVFLLLCLAVVPLLALPARLIGRKLADKAKLLQRQAGGVNSIVQENLQARAEVRLFNLQERQYELFEEQVSLMQTLRLKVVKYDRMLSPIVEVLSAAGLSAAIFYSVRSGITLDRVIPLIFALAVSYAPLKQFGVIYNAFKRGTASLDRVEWILHQDETLRDSEHPESLGDVRGAVEFRNVGFSYDGSTPVLHDVTESFPPGAIVALVGRSGAGKSTFANLIPRLYDASTGSVRVDGVDVRDVRKSELRRAISVVSQDPLLFNATVHDNIRVGRLDATREEVEEAARKAFADDFIRGLEKGYGTRVGERGLRLSGGQKQRIAIARAFLRNAPILILDEATSSLDSESEAKVQRALAELVHGRTTFIIAHRFSTLRIAQRVLFFESGRITASGTSDELLERSEGYRALFDLQADTSWTGRS